MCIRDRHNAKMTIGRYQRTNRPITIIATDTDYWPIVRASLVLTYTVQKQLLCQQQQQLQISPIRKVEQARDK